MVSITVPEKGLDGRAVKGKSRRVTTPAKTPRARRLAPVKSGKVVFIASAPVEGTIPLAKAREAVRKAIATRLAKGGR